MSVLVVTGTGTGVGKTVTTAALAACALRAGLRVAVVKPVQTGVRPGEPGDLAEVSRLTGLADLHEYVRYPEPLAPATAARRAGERGPDLAELARRVAGLAGRDLVLVEGAGGALVRFNDRDETICTLATELRRLGSRVRVVMVTGSALGALHDAAATAAALRARSLDPEALVVGDWPAEPGLAERCNLTDLAGYAGAPVAGVLPHGAGNLPAAAFAEMAAARLAPTLGGGFDAAGFLRAHAAPATVPADPLDPADSTDPADRTDRTAPADSTDPVDRTDRTDPTDRTDRADRTDSAVPGIDHGHATVPNRESPR